MQDSRLVLLRLLPLPIVFAGLLSAAFVAPRAQADEPVIRIAVRPVEAKAPSGRIGAGTAYDSKQARIIIFGGADPKAKVSHPTLMTFDPKVNTWSSIEVEQAGPRAVAHPSMVYDPKRHALFVFGGWARGAEQPSAELWVLHLAKGNRQRWQLLCDGEDGPSARNGAGMVLDAKRDRLLLHGGDGGPHPTYGYTPLDDLWAYDLADGRWAQLRPAGDAPEPRWNHAVALDSDNAVMYAFGGAGYVGDHEVLDRGVYALDMQKLSWTKLTGRGDAPPVVLGATLTYDPDANVLLVVGGLVVNTPGQPGSRNVWCFDLATRSWSEHARLLPTTRRDHVAVYDPANKQHVIYGGHTALGQDYYTVGEMLRDALIIKVKRSTSPPKPGDLD